MIPSFDYVRARNLEDAVEHLAGDKAHIQAGGTDLLGCLRDDVFGIETLVNIKGIDGLEGVNEADDGALLIGALTTVTSIEQNPIIRERFPGLAQAAAEVASPQLRNQGTIGGNLCQKPRCWYYRGDFDCLRKGGSKCFAVAGENQYHCIFGGAGCFIVHPSDIAPALVALDAEVHISGPDGSRRLPVADLHMRPADNPTRETVLASGEVITRIKIPAPAEGLYSSYRKIRTRRSWDFAIAGCALALRRDDTKVADCRVVLSGAAPFPWRSREAEEALRGRELDENHIGQAAGAAVSNAQPMTKNGYKIALFRNMLIEELRKALA